MSAFLVAAAVVLLVLFALGLWQVVRGRDEADRMLVVQLVTTTTVGLLLLLAIGLGRSALLDVALVFVLLAVLVAVAFVRRPDRIMRGGDQ